MTFRDEAADFTPWLAENLGRLGHALGMRRLRLIERESRLPMSDKKVDILAEELDLDTSVVIENQLNMSDDQHLGKLLAYSCEVKAGVAVWVAPSFRREHISVMNWVNERFGASFQMYGVEAEIRKDRKAKSDTRLYVGPESHPSHWDHEERNPVPNESRDADDMYMSFWQSLVDELQAVEFTRKSKSSSRRYYELSTGLRDLKYVVSFAPIRGTASVSLVIKQADDMQQSSWIIDEVSDRLRLERDDHRRKAGIRRKAKIDDSAERLSRTRSWMVKKLLRFRKELSRIIE